MNHLKIINHNYYFRLCIPQDLKAIFGCCEIKRSLATCLRAGVVDKMSRTKLSRELLGAVVKLHSVMESHALGDYDVMMPGFIPQVQPEIIPEITSIFLGELADAYEKDKRGSWALFTMRKESFSY